MCSEQPSHGSCCHGLPRTEDSGHSRHETDGAAEALRDAAATTSDADETTTVATAAADANDATDLQLSHDGILAFTSTHDEDGGNAGGSPKMGGMHGAHMQPC